jgi:hypothetical protein
VTGGSRAGSRGQGNVAPSRSHRARAGSATRNQDDRRLRPGRRPAAGSRS